MNKNALILEHVGDNIKEDYIIGKVLGTGIKCFFTSKEVMVKCEFAHIEKLKSREQSKLSIKPSWMRKK